jgi:hypothetical protein
VNCFSAAGSSAGHSADVKAKEAVMLITFLVAMLALVIAIVGCAVVNPGYHADAAGEQDVGAPDWESSI